MFSNSEELTIFHICYKLYKYKVLFFRLTNRPAIYQQYINNILFEYLDNFCSVYFDNILIYSDNELKYQQYIKKILQQLCNTRLQADIKKYEFNIIKTKYIGFILSTDSIEVNPKKISIVRK
jgi:hypothetical protein